MGNYSCKYIFLKVLLKVVIFFPPGVTKMSHDSHECMGRTIRVRQRLTVREAT